jgi:hypothetical protein
MYDECPSWKSWADQRSWERSKLPQWQCLQYDHARGGNDVLFGGDANRFDQLYGDAVFMYDHSIGGNDVMISGSASFTVMHGDGAFMDDYAVGGDDVLISGTGGDLMYGGDQVMIGGNLTAGSDIFVFGQRNAATSSTISANPSRRDRCQRLRLQRNR